MKRIFQVLAIMMILFFAVVSNAKSPKWILYLGTSDPSPTAPSGVSTLVVSGGGYNRADGHTVISGLDELKGDAWIVQIIGIDCPSGSSGNTFTLRYKETVVNTDYHWEKAQTIDVFSGTALSGDSLIQVPVYPEGMGSIQWEWITGTESISGASIMFKSYD
jgi:hypothetical protein